MSKEEVIEITQQLHGWCTKEKAERLYDFVGEYAQKERAPIIVELGTFGGRSLFPMVFASIDDYNGGVYGIDAWDNIAPLEGTNAPENNAYWGTIDILEEYRSCLRFIFEHNLQNYCQLIRDRSDVSSRLFADNSIGIIHEDSNHNIETITAELDLWVPKLKLGGYWIIDDCDWVEAKDGYAKLPDYGLELVEDHKTWQIWKKVK